MARRALIGNTGFVGGNLGCQMAFDDLYHSRNIAEIAGREYELVVCAGVPAVKWVANKDPEDDWKAIRSLLHPLEQVKAERFILISTVDVYDPALGVDERTPVRTEGLHAYGLHRYRVEEFVRGRFRALIVRLCGLFGKGLKKNVVYDFLTGNSTDAVDHRGVFQFYSLDHLAADLSKAETAGLDLLHLTADPLSVAEIARTVFGREFNNPVQAKPPRYDFRSVHAALWNREVPYQYSREQILEEMKDFVGRALTEGLLGKPK